MDYKIYTGTVGIKLIVETGQDLSTASQVSLLVKKPDKSQVEWVGVANGTTIEYVVKSGDLDLAGTYIIHAKAVFANGDVWFGQAEKLVVYELFE